MAVLGTAHYLMRCKQSAAGLPERHIVIRYNLIRRKTHSPQTHPKNIGDIFKIWRHIQRKNGEQDVEA
jgi:hypothetical protein